MKKNICTRGKPMHRLFCLMLVFWSFAVIHPTAHAFSEIQGVLFSFHNLAVMDCTAAMDIWASDALKPRWENEGKPVLGDRLLANAFFEPALTLAGQDLGDTWFAGMFNPWVNMLLIFKIEKSDQGFRITDFDLVTPSRTNQVPENIDADSLAALLTHRIETARETVGSLDASWTGSHGSRPWEILKESLLSRIHMMRSVLSPQGEARYQDLRTDFGNVMKTLRGKADGMPLDIKASEPGDWKRTLQPVHLVHHKQGASIVFFSRPFPTSLLWITLDPSAGQQVIEARILELNL